MISDILSDAVEAIREYQADFPNVYDSRKRRLDKLVADMEAMRIELDTSPGAAKAMQLADEAAELAEAPE